MDNSSSDWESDEEDGDYTSDDEESFKITKEDILRDVLPANTILLQHGNVSNLHEDLIDDFEDVWVDQDNIGNIGWLEDGVTCSCCEKIAYPTVEMIVLEETRYFLIFEEMISKVKCKGNELEGFLQCVYCFNYYHRFGCTLSMSIQSYISCLLSRNYACPSCVPEYIPVAVRKIQVKSASATDSDLLINIFQSLNKCSNFNPIKSCCNIVANYIV